MGLFSKKKEENSKANLPPPPSPPNNAGDENKNMPSPNQEIVSPENAMAFKSEDRSLNPPPVPGIQGLSEIKKEVAGIPENFNNNDFNSQNINNNDQSFENHNGIENNSQTSEDLNLTAVSDDSLFNLDELDFPNEENNSNVPSVEMESNIKSSPEDPNMKKEGNFEFLEKDVMKRAKEDKPIFITTNQFKNMMEIIEDVKLKVKESSDTHLRLMDIKAEEDIEFENLRKSFQFFEEKLYQLDNILFEK